MNKDILLIAANAMKVSPEEAEKHYKAVDQINGFYFWNPVRGGIAVLVNLNGEKLAATSSVRYETHLQAFLDGRRN